jgi:hypothetical protein
MSPKKPDQSFNSRKYEGQLNRELIFGVIIITIVVGGGIVALRWGHDAFLTALGCIALAVGLGGVLWLFLKFIEIISRD